MKKIIVLFLMAFCLIYNKPNAEVRFNIEESKVCNINYSLPKDSFTPGEELVLKDIKETQIDETTLREDGVVFFENVPFGDYLIEKTDNGESIPLILKKEELNIHHITKPIVNKEIFFKKEEAISLLQRGLDVHNIDDYLKETVVDGLPKTGIENHYIGKAILLLALGVIFFRKEIIGGSKNA